MMRTIFVIFFFICSTDFFSQAMAHTYGGANNDNGYSLVRVGGGDFVLTGITWSYGPANSNNYLLRVKNNGDTVWTRATGNGSEYGYKIELSKDSFLFAGGSQGSQPGYAATIKKLDLNGNVLWGRSYGLSNGTLQDIRDFTLTTDKGYVGVGISTFSVTPLTDFFVFKADSTGSLQWGKHFQGNKWDYGMAVAETKNGYAIGGYTDSYNNRSNNFYDAFLLQLDKSGDTLWFNTYNDTTQSTRATSMKCLSDGGFALFGLSTSPSSGNDDLFLTRIDSIGNLLWTKRYGSSGAEAIGNFLEMPDKGFLLMGNTGATSGGGNWDILFVRTNSVGDTLWTRTFGGNSNDYSKQIILNDSGFTVVGSTGGLVLYNSSMDMVLFTTDTAGQTDCFSHSANILVSSPTFTTTSVHPTILSNVSFISVSHPFVRGCTAVEWCNNTTSVKNNFDEKEVFVYPNPFSDKLYVDFKTMPGKKNIILFSAMGKMIKKMMCSGNNCILERDEIAAGFYFLQITEESGFSKRIKIIIE